jgi:hypothetical protein
VKIKWSHQFEGYRYSGCKAAAVQQAFSWFWMQ